MSIWNSISGVTAAYYFFAGGVVLGSLSLLINILQLRNSDRRMTTLRSDDFSLSTKRMKSIESAAGDIRKELLDVQQERDILIEKLKVKEDELEKIHYALDDAVKQRSELSQTTQPTEMVQSSDGESEFPLSTEQREQLIALLDPGPKGDVDIISVIGDHRSNLLAQELDKIFKADGWSTKGAAQSAFSKVPEGIVLSVHSKETAPSYASFIQRTMATVGFPVSAAVNNKYREWSLTLIVGKIS